MAEVFISLTFDRGPKFELVATAKLMLDNVSNNTATFDLNMENVGKFPWLWQPCDKGIFFSLWCTCSFGNILFISFAQVQGTILVLFYMHEIEVTADDMIIFLRFKKNECQQWYIFIDPVFPILTENRANQLPLFGHFCCRLAAQPDCATQERIAGYAHVTVSLVSLLRTGIYWKEIRFCLF